MIAQRWCSIRGHWFFAEVPDLDGTKESNGPVELRDDCPDCSFFIRVNWWRIPRYLGFFWRYWICGVLTRPYWKFRARRMRCLGCHSLIEKDLALLYAIFEMVNNYVCDDCSHDPKPECGPDCKFCK